MVRSKSDQLLTSVEIRDQLFHLLLIGEISIAVSLLQAVFLKRNEVEDQAKVDAKHGKEGQRLEHDSQPQRDAQDGGVHGVTGEAIRPTHHHCIGGARGIAPKLVAAS
jgi:hypothetical protein